MLSTHWRVARHLIGSALDVESSLPAVTGGSHFQYCYPWGWLCWGCLYPGTTAARRTRIPWLSPGLALPRRLSALGPAANQLLCLLNGDGLLNFWKNKHSSFEYSSGWFKGFDNPPPPPPMIVNPFAIQTDDSQAKNCFFSLIMLITMQWPPTSSTSEWNRTIPIHRTPGSASVETIAKMS